MIRFTPLLAQEIIVDVADKNNFTGSAFLQWMLILGSLIAASLIGAILIVVFRKKFGGRKHHRHRRKAPEKIPATSGDKRALSAPAAPRKRGRKSRRTHRPRNPTLAETRGLPPIRGQQTHSTPPSK